MSGPTRKTLDLVWARDESACFMCHRALARDAGDYSIHHRRPRGMGGTSDPVADSPVNLLLLCGSGTTGCHGAVERNRVRAVANGFIVQQGVDPATVPISYVSAWEIYLTDDGRKKFAIDGQVIVESALPRFNG